MKPISSTAAQATFNKPIPPGIARQEQQLPPGQLRRLDNLPKGIEARFPRPAPTGAEPPAGDASSATTSPAPGSTLDITA